MTQAPRPTALEMRVETGPCAGTCAIIHALQGTIGRADSCDLCLEHDATVSREHAALTWEAGEWVLRDLGSKNGTALVTPGGSMAIAGATAVAPGSRFMTGSAIIGLYAAAAEATPEQLRVHLERGELHFELMGTASVVAKASQPYAHEVVTDLQREIRLLVAAAHAGAVDADVAFLQFARRLTRVLLPESIAVRLEQAESPLGLVLDPALLSIPWELLTTADAPICLHRSISRQVVAEKAPIHTARGAAPPRILIVANPTGDIRAAQAEAEDLLHQIVHVYGLHDVRFLAAQRARKAEVLEAFSSCDAIIYIGHAEHDAASPQTSGWRLADGVLPAEAFMAATGAPRLILASACESARETSLEDDLSADTAGFAATLMLAGAEQFIGTQWPVPVVSGAAFATVSFTEVMRGHTTGEAVLLGRRHLRHVLGAPLHVCSGYVHYGSPQWRLWRQ